MRVIGIDLGAKRVGVAVSDSEAKVAVGHSTLERSGQRPRDWRRIAEIASELGAELIVVGIPLSLDGTLGPAARGVLEEVAALRSAVNVPVQTHDERMTTLTATRALRATGVRRDARRGVIDQSAAAVMLQSWLDARMGAGESTVTGPCD